MSVARSSTPKPHGRSSAQLIVPGNIGAVERPPEDWRSVEWEDSLRSNRACLIVALKLRRSPELTPGAIDGMATTPPCGMVGQRWNGMRPHARGRRQPAGLRHLDPPILSVRYRSDGQHGPLGRTGFHLLSNPGRYPSVARQPCRADLRRGRLWLPRRR